MLFVGTKQSCFFYKKIAPLLGFRFERGSKSGTSSLRSSSLRDPFGAMTISEAMLFLRRVFL